MEWIIEHQQVDADEAHFYLDGFVNCQNCRIWGSENPHVIVEKPMHPQRATVWCGFQLEASLDHAFLKMRLPSSNCYWCSISRHDYTVPSRNWMILMVPISGFNKTVSHAIQPVKQLNFCTSHLWVV